MKKQAKVKVDWTKDEVCLSTDRGVNFYFRKTFHKPSRGTCETLVAGLVSSLIVPTVKAAFDDSDNDEFIFEFIVMDKKECFDYVNKNQKSKVCSSRKKTR